MARAGRRVHVHRMDAFLFHPKLVHVPMALGVLMPIISAGLLLAWWRKWLPPRAWLVAVGLQAALVGSGILAMKTGSAQEDRVEAVVAESAIERHEEAAEQFVWASGAVLALMLLAAAAAARRPGPAFATVATLGTVVVLGFGYRTGEAGGALVYEHGAARAYTSGVAGPPAVEVTPRRDDDD